MNSTNGVPSTRPAAPSWSVRREGTKIFVENRTSQYNFEIGQVYTSFDTSKWNDQLKGEQS